MSTITTRTRREATAILVAEGNRPADVEWALGNLAEVSDADLEEARWDISFYCEHYEATAP